jgi:hypothetical protein
MKMQRRRKQREGTDFSDLQAGQVQLIGTKTKKVTPLKDVTPSFHLVPEVGIEPT